VRSVSTWGVSLLVLFAGAGFAAPAASADVVLNEVNCDGTDWIELANTSATPTDISGWVLSDEPLNGSGHPLTLPNPTTIPGNGHLAFVRNQPGSFTFGIGCSDTIRLGSPGPVPVEAEKLPDIDFDLDSWGRVPDATGEFRQTFPTQGTANLPSPSGVDEAAGIFDPTQVADIDLVLPPASIDALTLDPHTDDYQPGTITLTTSTTNYGPLNVGIRLKGTASFRSLDGKAAFKIKIPDSVPGQRLAGLRKLTLNNMVQDPSMVHELLAYRAYRAMGLTAPRTGYAKVSVNGTDYGLHLNLETYDEVSLAGLPSTQHLYEGAVGNDVDGAAGDFEIDEGTKGGTADLDALIAAVDGGTPEDFFDRVAGFADLRQMVRMWAVEKYIGQWDGYTGLDAPFSPNNYYLHSDDSGLFTMLPSGPDQAWSDHLHFDSTGGGTMFEKCLADPSCLELYRQAVKDARGVITGLNLDDLATSTASLLAPYETSSREEHTPGEIVQAVSQAVDFIHSRPVDVAEWLEENPADPGTPQGVAGATASSPPAAKKKVCKHAKRSAAKPGKCHKKKPGLSR
jgi:hypothetical protein